MGKFFRASTILIGGKIHLQNRWNFQELTVILRGPEDVAPSDLANCFFPRLIMSENEELPLIVWRSCDNLKNSNWNPAQSLSPKCWLRKNTHGQAISVLKFYRAWMFGVPLWCQSSGSERSGLGLSLLLMLILQPWLDALEPLIAQRRIEARDRFLTPFLVQTVTVKAESASARLNRHGAALMMIDPAQGTLLPDDESGLPRRCAI